MALLSLGWTDPSTYDPTADLPQMGSQSPDVSGSSSTDWIDSTGIYSGLPGDIGNAGGNGGAGDNGYQSPPPSSQQPTITAQSSTTSQPNFWTNAPATLSSLANDISALMGHGSYQGYSSIGYQGQSYPNYATTGQISIPQQPTGFGGTGITAPNINIASFIPLILVILVGALVFRLLSKLL